MSPDTRLDFVVAIPARYAASRLPGKPLRLIGREPLVLHVARRALAAGARDVWVAADDERIVHALEGSGVRIAMTSPDHASGTDRLAQCARIAGWDDDTIVVNLQGDEPFAPASGIRAAAQALVDTGADMATLATPIDDAATLFDPNAVKLVRAEDGTALYFSRAPIPWPRDAFSSSSPRKRGSMAEMDPRFFGDDFNLPPGDHWLRHIGLYAYRAAFLQRFAAMPPGRLERLESLEQLRVLEAGHRIAVALAPEPFPPGVDTPEDLARAEARWSAM